jgi:hypothetical protein
MGILTLALLGLLLALGVALVIFVAVDAFGLHGPSSHPRASIRTWAQRLLRAAAGDS